MDLRTQYVNNLKKIRNARGFSQSKLASQAGVSTAYIGQIEIGLRFPSIDLIQKIASALEVQPHLFFLPDDESSPEIADIHPLKREPGLSEAEKQELIRKLQHAVEHVVERYEG